MSDSSAQKPEQEKKPGNTARIFQRLLDWLDQGPSSEGKQYLEIRKRLGLYFDRKNCKAPDELADETLNRVARRLEEEGELKSETPAKYCYTVARFVFMEHLRETQRFAVALDEIRRRDKSSSEVDYDKEKMLNCLERCTKKLEPAPRELITRYYAGKERAKIVNRRTMAEEFGLTMNALAIRACRIRDKLEACVRECASER